LTVEENLRFSARCRYRIFLLEVTLCIWILFNALYAFVITSLTNLTKKKVAVYTKFI
jgi:hypothetical protein